MGLHHHSHDNDSHAHGHSHSHHNHDVKDIDFGNAFAIGAILNIGFVLVEFIAGVMIKSLALIADAGHNLSDVIGLILAWLAFVAAKKKPEGQFTYGYGHSTIVASFINSIFLYMASGIIAFEAIKRLLNPEPQEGMMMIIVASIGVVINLVTAFLFAAGRKHDLNIRATFLHMVYDGLVSLGVILGAVIIIITGWQWVDPMLGLLIVGVIIYGSWDVLKQSFKLSLAAAPDNIEIAKVAETIKAINGVVDIHDLHVWALSTTQNALSVHVIVDDLAKGQDILDEINHELGHDFELTHNTIQIETNYNCGLSTHI